MTGLDLLVIPLFLTIIIGLALLLKNNFVRAKTEKYFIPALLLKLFGAVLVGVIYQFYYKGGDTFNFFFNADIIYQAILDKPLVGLSLVFNPNPDNYEQFEYIRKLYFFKDSSSFFLIKIFAISLVLSFGTYGGASLIFAVFSFSGLWVLYSTITKIYPGREKQFAIAILFIPSVAFWGSGLLKDTLTMTGVCWYFYAFNQIFFNNKRNLFNVFLLLIAIYVISVVKVYIIIAILPASLMWLSLTFSKLAKSSLVRGLVTPLALVFGISVGLILIAKIGETSSKFNIDNIAQTAEVNARWLSHMSDIEGGSGYTLGDFDFSYTGILLKFFPAVNVTLFRPYIWEVKNVVMLLSAAESLIFLLITIITIKKRGLRNVLTTIMQNPFLVFCFIFTVIFAFAIGVATYNFGSLVRYKIPVLPFYGIFLVLLGNYREKRFIKVPA